MKTKKLKNTIIRLGFALLLAALAFLCFGCNLPSSEGEAPSDGSTPDPSENTPAIVIPSGDAADDRYESSAWKENYTLPDAEGALEKLEDIYGGADKVFLLQKEKVARMPCPQGEMITLNMTYKIDGYVKLILEDSVAEFNEVFSVINPNYRFAINYSPTETDFAKKYSVKMSSSDNLPETETSQVFGFANVGYYENYTLLGDFGITIKSEVLNNGSYLMTTFKHELMHLLGAGDAYKNANATKQTIMQSYTVNGYHFLSETDVAFLDALYRNPELDVYGEDISEYIEQYEENNTHTRTNLTAAVYKKLADGLNPVTVVNQAAAIGYKDLTEFSASVKDGIARNAEFGQTAISFKEIEYAQTPTETYFGSIDPKTGTYWHGSQKGTMGNSQGIKYTDYGSGILYAAPNGNQYTVMMQTGNFVLAFKLNGSFTNLSALSLDLWHISN